MIKKFDFLNNSIILILCSLSFAISLYYVKDIPFHLEESDILDVVLWKLGKGKYQRIFFADFPYLFFEYGYYIFNFFKNGVHLIESGRIINALLGAINTYLFYLNIKNYLTKKWALFGATLFIFTPIIIFTSIRVKVESLLLLELLLSFYFCFKYQENNQKKIYLILGAFVMALGFYTKYHPTFPFIFLLSHISNFDFKEDFKTFKNLKKIFFNHHIYFFVFFYLIFLLTTGDFFEILNRLYGDYFDKMQYFMDSPRPNRAVDEFFSFPYGKYSYPMFTTFPFMVSCLVFLCSCLGIFGRLIPNNVLTIWGGFSLIQFVFYSNITLARTMYFYILCVPFLLFSAIYFIKYFLELKVFSKFYLKYIGLIIFIIPSFIEHKQIVDYYYNFGIEIQNAIHYLENKEKTHIPSPLFLSYPVEMNWPLKNGKKRDKLIRNDNLDFYINIKRPNYIIANSVYIDNFCKYRKHIDYKRECKFFKNLLSEKLNYEIIWKSHVFNPKLGFAYFDPELNKTIFILRRKVLLTRGIHE